MATRQLQQQAGQIKSNVILLHVTEEQALPILNASALMGQPRVVNELFNGNMRYYQSILISN